MTSRRRGAYVTCLASCWCTCWCLVDTKQHVEPVYCRDRLPGGFLVMCGHSISYRTVSADVHKEQCVLMSNAFGPHPGSRERHTAAAWATVARCLLKGSRRCCWRPASGHTVAYSATQQQQQPQHPHRSSSRTSHWYRMPWRTQQRTAWHSSSSKTVVAQGFCLNTQQDAAWNVSSSTSSSTLSAEQQQYVFLMPALSTPKCMQRDTAAAAVGQSCSCLS